MRAGPLPPVASSSRSHAPGEWTGPAPNTVLRVWGQDYATV